MTADEVVARVARYKPYFGLEGGVTLSGGEPLLQARFAAEIMRGCKANGIHTALDTSGQMLNDDVRACLDATDLVLLDIKHANPEAHRELVGLATSLQAKPGQQAAMPAVVKQEGACSPALGDLARTLEFMEEVARRGTDLWVRQVIIPGITDSPAQIEALAKLVRGRPNLRKVELLPYHTMARAKWEALGLAYPLGETPQPTSESLANLQALLERLLE